MEILVDLIEKGSYDEALSQLRQIDTNNEEENHLKSLFAVEIYIFKGLFKDALNLIEKLKSTANQLSLYSKIYFAILSASYFIQTGDLISSRQALNAIESEVDRIFKSREFEHSESIQQKWFSRFFHTRGNLNYLEGRLNNAELDYRAAIKLRKIFHDQKGLASTLLKISLVHKQRGELSEAKSSCLEAISLEKKIGNNQALGVALNALALIYREEGEYPLAIEHFRKSLEMMQVQKNPYLLSIANYELFITFKQFDVDEAIRHASLIQALYDENRLNKRIEYLNKLTRSITLKLSTRGSDKFKGQELLKELIHVNNIDHTIRTKALIFYIRSLIDEFRAFGTSDVLNEVEELIHELKETAQTKRSQLLFGELMLIEANIALVKGEIKLADEMFVDALNFTRQNELNWLAHKIEAEKGKFEAEIQTWVSLAQAGSSIMDRMQKLDMDAYLDSVTNLLDSGIVDDLGLSG